MLADPLKVGFLDDAAAASIRTDLNDSFLFANLGTFALVPQTTPGVTKRHIAGTPSWSLTISRSFSNENKPLQTQRIVVRLDRKGLDTVTGVESTASAYIVLSVPQGTDGNTETDTVTCAQTLMGLLLVGSPDPSDAKFDGTDSNYLYRLLNGEG